MANIIRQVTFERANRRKDKSVSLSFTTDLEQSTLEFMEMDKLIGSRGVIHYSDRGELTQAEIDKLDEVDVELEGKTKSQRLRSVLYLYSKQLGEEDFKKFYSEYMEKIIQAYKNKLD